MNPLSLKEFFAIWLFVLKGLGVGVGTFAAIYLCLATGTVWGAIGAVLATSLGLSCLALIRQP